MDSNVTSCLTLWGHNHVSDIYTAIYILYIPARGPAILNDQDVASLSLSFIYTIYILKYIAVPGFMIHKNEV